MKKLEWSDELSLGVLEIDAQHKELLRIANGLLQAISLGRPERTITNVIRKLREYTVFHFNSEEAFMDRIGYNKKAEHFAKHSVLKKKVKEFQRTIYEGNVVDADKLMSFLKVWLLKHILESDRELVVFIKTENISTNNFDILDRK